MRTRSLNRTVIVLIGIFVAVAMIFGVLRNTVFQQQEHGHGHEQHGSAQGAALFQSEGCAQCHATDSGQTKIGPGLQGLFDREELPASGRAVTEENITKQLRDPYRNMPSFAERLTPEQEDQIIDHLKTL